MAKTVSEFPTTTRNAKYDWTSWLNGEVWELIEGEDFKVTAQSFRGALYAAKVKRGVEVETAKIYRNGKVIVVVHAVGATKPARKPAAKKATAKPRKPRARKAVAAAAA